jgi:hypothetical protein
MFERLLRRLPDLELATRDPLVHILTGIEQMPVRFTPTRPAGAA